MNYSSFQASSAASISSDASTVRASNRDTTSRFDSLSNMANPSILTESQKASFYAVWDAISDLRKSLMIHHLQSLVGAEFQVGNGGDQAAKEEMLSEMNYDLCYNATAEHSANVSQFMIELQILSSETMLEMLSMTEPGPTVFVVHAAGVQDGNHHDNEERPVSTIAASTATTVANTVVTAASTLSTAASSTVSTATSTASTAASTASTAPSTVSNPASTASTAPSTVSNPASTASTAASTVSDPASTGSDPASTAANAETIASL